ncbi:hypothetical protein HMPREF3293_02568 [Christensenella minuta]|uniref:Uncharacterized protein n=1 Tax=Christensenella minuta TaxID=626937 RepID=A0A136Q1D1_9FIRM|nr:hypothetical protein HMPREF3293_02568 [Christensenella minuta]
MRPQSRSLIYAALTAQSKYNPRLIQYTTRCCESSIILKFSYEVLLRNL